MQKNIFLHLSIILLLSTFYIVKSINLEIEVYNQEDFALQMKIAEHSWAKATSINIRFLKDQITSFLPFQSTFSQATSCTEFRLSFELENPNPDRSLRIDHT